MAAPDTRATDLDLPVDLGDYNALLAVEPDAADDPDGAREQTAEAATALLAGFRALARPVHRRSGTEAEIVERLAETIEDTREILVDSPRARRAELVAEAVVDHLLQRRADRWRGWVEDGRLASDDARGALRREFAHLQRGVRRVVRLLEKVREAEELVPDDLFLGIPMPAGPPRIRSRRALAPVVAGLQRAADLPDVPAGRVDEEAVFAAELPVVLDRPHRAVSPQPTELVDATGLALSGGGIRSATFALGVLQVLARRGVLTRLDYLSTVSGGGYLGSLVTHMLQRAPDGQETERVRTLFGKRQAENTTRFEGLAVRHLRNRSRYLVEGGLLMDAGLMMARGILTNLVALLPLVLLGTLATLALREATPLWSPPDADSWSGLDLRAWFTGSGTGNERPPAVDAFYLLAGAALAFQVVLRPVWAGVGRAFGSAGRGGAVVANVTTGLAVLAGVVACTPPLFRLVAMATESVPGGEWSVPAVAALLARVSARLSANETLRRFAGPVLKVVLALSPIVLLLGLYVAVTNLAFAQAAADSGFYAELVIVLIGLVVFLWFFMDLNALSPHGFYKQKIASCYLTDPDDPEPDQEPTPVRLSTLGTPKGPYHLINAALNVPGSRQRALRGRQGDFFLFSPKHCGSPLTGYRPTAALEDDAPELDLATAMAISGAAFSSNMAVLGLDHLRFYLALLNVRLGYWLPHLGGTLRPAPSVLDYWRELRGTMDETHAFVNVSDGGHIENLGVFELLRRKCKYVVAVDGECDTGRVFDGLIKLVRYARIDLGATIDVDLGPLAADERGRSRAHSALGKITYHDGDIGWLLYVKSSLTGNEPPHVLDYQREKPEFPHETTLDQIYSERQFEAYRALGEHVAEEHFERSLLESVGRALAANSRRGDTDVRDWFEALAVNMLPDNDPVFAPDGLSDPNADAFNLEGLQVGLSISQCEETDEAAVNERTVELAQDLIRLGATIVSGHDWQRNRVMARLREFAKQDRALHRRRLPAIRNRTRTGDELPASVEQLAGEGIDAAIVDEAVHRPELTALSEARVCLGGKTRKARRKGDGGFTGDRPGVLEEALLAVRADQPLLVSGALGGTSKWIAESLLGDGTKAPDYKRDAPDADDWPASTDEAIEELRAAYATLPSGLRALHRRLWETTDWTAARALIVETLARHAAEDAERDADEDRA